MMIPGECTLINFIMFGQFLSYHTIYSGGRSGMIKKIKLKVLALFILMDFG